MSESLKKLQVAIQALSSGVNNFGDPQERAALVKETFRREHRTLQQAMMRSVIIPILEALAEDYREGRTDARNKAAGRMAYQMLQAVEEDAKYLPFV